MADKEMHSIRHSKGWTSGKEDFEFMGQGRECNLPCCHLGQELLLPPKHDAVAARIEESARLVSPKSKFTFLAEVTGSILSSSL